MKRLISILVAILCAVGSASAQTAWYVNPSTGSDGNSGTLPTQPFRSLGHALTVASAGDNVFLAGGTYSVFETFPIGLRDGVRLSALGGTPVFDGGGAAVLFDLAEDVTQTTEISGLTFTDAGDCVRIVAGDAVDGLVFDGCEFQPNTNGLVATFSGAGAGQDLTVRDSVFLATAGSAAVNVQAGSGSTLAGGGVLDCEIQGVFAQGVLLRAAADGVIGTGFAVAGNSIDGCSTGISLLAEGGGLSATSASVAATVSGNSVTGASPAVDAGLRLEARRGAAGEPARVSSRIEFNDVRGCDAAVQVVTANNGSAVVDAISDFYGNVFAGTQVGIAFDVTQPKPGQRNADPNFGGDGEGGVACLNTFAGFVTDFQLDLDMTDTVYARFNWFDGAPSVAGGTVSTSPVYADELEGTVSGVFLSGVADQELTITAGATTGFVDREGSGEGQISVVLDTVTLPQSDLEALPIGAGLIVTLPALAAGNHTLTVTNPGGQSGEFSFAVGATPGGGGSGGCFVATAAHGDYDAPEVRELRALRDEYLAMSGPGRAFIRWYYRAGPAAADWIAERPWARAGARVALQPLVWTSGALTRWNQGERFAFAVLLLGAVFALLRRRQ